MAKHIIITSCTKRKSIDFRPNGRRVSPVDYLIRPDSVKQLRRTRKLVLALPGSEYCPQEEQRYAYDLYVRGKTQLYSNLRKEEIDVRVREKLLAAKPAVDWYFLSGGYGLLHALELVKPYQATFFRIKGTPFTLRYWKEILPALLDEVFQKNNSVESVHVFGSTPYVDMVRDTKRYRTQRDLFPDVCEGKARDKKVRAALVKTVRRLFRL
jgi:cytoplasmic iron level regulating protein YaaA (DUF328/UPF0246 family)